MHAEGGRACGRGGHELSPVRVPEVQTRAVVRTHLIALRVLLVLRRETDIIHRGPVRDLHGRHHARGSLGGAARRELRLLGEGANELAEASIIATTKVRIMRLIDDGSLLVPALLFRSSRTASPRWFRSLGWQRGNCEEALGLQFPPALYRYSQPCTSRYCQPCTSSRLCSVNNA